MPILNKPEQIVLRVLSRLTKIKDGVIHQPQTGDDVISKLSSLEKHLEEIRDVVSQVKFIEKTVIEQFKILEWIIDREDFLDSIKSSSSSTDRAGEELPKVFCQVDQLTAMAAEVESLRRLIVDDDHQPQDATTTTMTTRTNDSKSKNRAYKEWPPDPVGGDIPLLSGGGIESFRSSFDKLDSESQFCLVSLSIFPRNSVINKRLIIQWWIAEGFIDNTNPRFFPEDVGDRVFQKLVNRRFIQPGSGVYWSPSGQPRMKQKRPPFMNSFMVHPWIRLLLILLAKEAQLFDFDGMGRPKNIQGQAFLMSDLDRQDNTSAVPTENPENLVSIFNINQQYLKFSADRLSRLKKVEFLQLGRWQDSPEHHIEIEDDKSLEGLSTLKNLRYLFLRGISRIFSLPQSLTQLISLEVLDLKACHNLEKLPPDISSFWKLTHLDISECYLLESMPSGIEKLSKLQVLKGFVVGIKSKASCKIRDLASLTELRKLSIFIGAKATAAVINDQGFEILEKIVSLRNLAISWQVFTSSPPLSSSFRLPSGLEKLDLRCIPEADLPEWVDLRRLKHLRKLYIRGGQLRSLRYDHKSDRLGVRVLRLKYLKLLSITKLDLRAMFPHAFYLEATECQDKGDYMWIKE